MHSKHTVQIKSVQDEFKDFLPGTDDLECDMHLPFNLDDNQPFDLKSNSSEEASESQILNLDEIELLEPQPELDLNMNPTSFHYLLG